MKQMSDKRAERLRAAGTLAYGSTFAVKRYPERPTKRHPLPKGPDNKTVLRVLRRDKVCVVCGAFVLGGERGWAWSLHHRRGRDGKPDSHAPQNLVLVCGSSNVDADHGRVHQERAWARTNGYWVSRTVGANPLLVPVRIAWLGQLAWLTADGQYSEEAPREAA